MPQGKSSVWCARRLRFRQIAIVTNAMEAYEKSLRGILEEYEIPCFIDARRETTAHPLVTLLTSLLDILVYDFKYEAVFSYLKSGLSLLSTEEIDILENYVLCLWHQGLEVAARYLGLWHPTRGRRSRRCGQCPAGQGACALRPPFLPFRRRRPSPFGEFLQALLSHLEQLHAPGDAR
ncbi:MAG: hypothetical protein V8Q32_06440 [Anaerotignum faecicola]